MAAQTQITLHLQNMDFEGEHPIEVLVLILCVLEYTQILGEIL